MEVVKRLCEVDLLGHCTFCQGKLTSGNKDGGADHNESGDEERSFDYIWTYLFKQEGGGHAGVKYVFKGDVDVSSVPAYQDVPPMCPCCEEKIWELHKLHTELMRKVEDVRKIVIAAGGQSDKKSKKKGGGLGEKLENSALEPSVKVSTLQFLNELVKACNKFQYTIGRYELQDEQEIKQGEGSPNFLEQLPKDSLEHELLIKEEPDSSDSMSSRSSNYEDEVEDHPGNENGFVNENSDSDGASEGSGNEDDPAAAVSPDEFEDESDMSDVEFEARGDSMEEDEDNKAAPSSQEESSADSEEELSEPELPHKRKKKQPNNKKPKNKLKSSHSHPVLKQRCDVCNQRIPFKELRQHLEAQHNVQDYFSKCPNPKCKYIYSNRRSLETLHLFSSSGKKCREFTDLPPEKKLDWFRKCEGCDFQHESIRAFKSHILFHENHQDLPKDFPCPLPKCEERYALRQSLELHISEHGLKHKSYKKSAKTHQPCPICPDKQQLQVGEDMTAHLKEAHAVQEVLSCRQCPFVFPNREELLKHLSRHKSDGILCDICDDGVKYTSHIRVLRHYLTKHQIGHEVECEICRKTFVSSNTLKSHQQVAHPELYPAPEKVSKSAHGCDICNKSCITEKGLILHKIKAHGADDDPLKCKICGRVSCNFNQLAIHMESHAGVQFKCREQNCDKICSTRRMLQKHIRSVHVVGKKACDICEKRFTSSTTLQRHVQNIHQGRKHLCSTCGVQYRTAYFLEVHMRTHTGLKPYQCSKCGLRFHDKCHLKSHMKKPTCGEPRRTNQRRHINTVHLDRKHSCNACGAELSSAKSLKAHMKLHAGGEHEPPLGDGEGGRNRSKTFKCNIEGCHDDKFPTMKELFHHRKVVHGGWGKLVCESCGKSFTTEKYLRLHNNRYHLGLLETFHCDICGKSSSSRTALRNHKMTHTGERPLSCHLCGQPFRTDAALRHHLRRHEEQGEKFQPRGPLKTYKGRPC